MLEHCELEFFTPKGLSKLEELSLEGNKIQDLNSIVLWPGEDPQTKDASRKKSSQGGAVHAAQKKAAKGGSTKIQLYEVKLRILNLADNRFEKFPYETLERMATLEVADISRNRISVLDRHLDFSKFEVLRVMDLSANGMHVFPEAV